ncbi:LLM class flavin-dependent oxidoreductase [Brevibacillus marinus]|uniref:LLM class flavin-dependent oxidoreductase n=1 Tax=Brevibacillus marinus TaxID=2496837 RepID=UPI000F84A626|nr:LLM class flavin-dependent oxidoreductase [Brevibacillus marinus]
MSQKQEKHLRLGAFLTSVGHHAAAWRYPQTNTNDLFHFAYYQSLAQTAEKGLFDLVFFADRLAISDRYENKFDTTVRHLPATRLEPITLIAALGAVTRHIGLVATASTTYNEPFSIARYFSTIDHITGGRAAWNIVTSTHDGEALNYSREKHLDHDLRYERAREFLDVAIALWDSWEDDALVLDKENGVFADPAKVHYLHHAGKWFQVKGPLNVPRSPQGHPVLVQAGSSPVGREFAAQTAEVIFTSQPQLEEAQAFYADIKSRAQKYGRTPDSIKIMPGVMPIIGKTEKEAAEKYRYLEELVHPFAGLALLSDSMNHDLSQYPLDQPLPELKEVRGNQSRYKLVSEISRRENLNLLELGKRFASSRSHRIVVGTPQQIADNLALWFESQACDGFNVMPPYLPGGLQEFVDLVVPELQQRGIFRTEYTGNTLRENLGLERPGNLFRTRQDHRVHAR